jgi:formylglycine-generating enzyme required for sulfatase activity
MVCAAGTAGAFEETTFTLPGDVPLVLVRIPAGTFTMGSPEDEAGRLDSEGPQHEVTISQDFYLGKYEVTQAQWQAVMGSPVPSGCDSYAVGDEYPVYCVSWIDICGALDTCGEQDGFLKRVNDHLVATNQSDGDALRLPTEAEWEYAARADTTTRFFFGDGSECDEPCGSCATYEDYMWWCGNAYYNSSSRGPQPVGRKLANPWGLFDIHGNVWEWVRDVTAPYDSEPQTDPTGPDLSYSIFRIVRGGGWGFWPASCRSARRGDFGDAGYRYHHIGFRLAASQ